jgi:hypothetical protein
VPTANSAASSQPREHVSKTGSLRRRIGRIAGASVAVVVGLAIMLPVELAGAPIVAAGASPSCPGWNSTTRPPDYIRVLRNATGRVDRVPFKKYVVTVLGKEWPGYLPQQVINAGAVAVKQFAWYHTLGNGRVSRRGQCFDVTDGIGDQLYKPGRARIRQDHYTALNATWGVRLLKGGSLFMTGYRTGYKGACGYDATGWKLYARSATRCAYRGMGFEQILRTYYGPVSLIGSGGNSAADGYSAASYASDTVTTDSSAASDSSSSDSASSSSTTPDSASSAGSAAPAATDTIGATCGQTGGVGLVVAVPFTAPAPAPVTQPETAPVGERAFTAA